MSLIHRILTVKRGLILINRLLRTLAVQLCVTDLCL